MIEPRIVGDVDENVGAFADQFPHEQTIVGPGSFLPSSIFVRKNGRLFIDNSAGPATLYVTGNVTVSAGGDITVADPNPEKFAIYMTNPASNLSMTGAGTMFYGVV